MVCGLRFGTLLYIYIFCFRHTLILHCTIFRKEKGYLSSSSHQYLSVFYGPCPVCLYLGDSYNNVGFGYQLSS